jgi:hypothetical protein
LVPVFGTALEDPTFDAVDLVAFVDEPLERFDLADLVRVDPELLVNGFEAFVFGVAGRAVFFEIALEGFFDGDLVRVAFDTTLDDLPFEG